MDNRNRERNLNISKVKLAIEHLMEREAGIGNIDHESLISEISSQLGVSERTAKEYVRIAKYKLEVSDEHLIKKKN